MASSLNGPMSILEFTKTNPIQGLLLNRYRVDKTLGKIVHSCEVAIKEIDESAVKHPREKKNIQRELTLLKLLHHPHIIKVIRIERQGSKHYILMEHASGGELHDLVTRRKQKFGVGLPEKEARRYFRQILSALEYCHESSVVHRDLKPENLLLDRFGNIKLIDFGFGNTFSDSSSLNTYCGSPFYAAPEMTQGIPYVGPEIDLWSLGVILYMMLTGSLPFQGTTIADLYEAIARGDPPMPSSIPASATHLLQRMLEVDPRKRATMEEIKKHPWTMEGYVREIFSHLPDRQSVIHNLDEPVLEMVRPLGYPKSDYVHAFLSGIPYKSPVKSLYHLHSEYRQRQKPDHSRPELPLANTTNKPSRAASPSLWAKLRPDWLNVRKSPTIKKV